MEGTMYGYIRVSTKDQNDDRQRIAMKKYGVAKENIFSDKQSGKDFERPGYKALLKQIRECDTLIIKTDWGGISMRSSNSGGISRWKRNAELWCWI